MITEPGLQSVTFTPHSRNLSPPGFTRWPSWTVTNPSLPAGGSSKNERSTLEPALRRIFIVNGCISVLRDQAPSVRNAGTCAPSRGLSQTGASDVHLAAPAQGIL